jgi:hypothetical protein
VHGTPKDVEGAEALAKADKYQFQWWAVSLLNAVPYGGKKKGADSGIDGIIYLKLDAKTTERAIISVKGGDSVSVPMIRDLKGVLEREKAPIGIFITLVEPTKPMLTEAASAGFFETDQGKYPRIQILTVAQLLHGSKPQLPVVDVGAGLKKAPTDTGHSSKQGKLL